MKITDLPFNRHIGLSIIDDHVRLRPKPNHENHFGTVHATAIFGVAEAATGHWMMCHFAELGDEYVAALRLTKLKFRRAAGIEHDIIGIAKCESDSIAAFKNELADRGLATLKVGVSVLQNDEELLSGMMAWFAAKKRS